MPASPCRFAVAAASAISALAACSGPTPAPTDPTGNDGFHSPTPVRIVGYGGDAMEPFASRDGLFVYFNDRNDPAVDTNLHFAERLDDSTLVYRGLLDGANGPALDAVASMDDAGLLYFISTRSYDRSLETVHRGRFTGTAVADVQLVDGLSRQQLGRINFDVEVTPDGGAVYLSDGLFTGGAVPAEADLALAVREGTGFRRSSDPVLAQVNTAALEYAAGISPDGLELFFTRVTGDAPAIYRAVRARRSDPFGPGARVGAADGFVEAPSLSPDSRVLYYHRREADGRYRLHFVRR